MKRILTILGTRPDTIKLAPVITELAKHPEELQSIVLATAQHREMLDQVLSVFNIRPDYDLNIMVKDQDLYHVTSHVLDKLKKILREIKPDVILVQGDTTTTFVGALAAYYEKILIGHVEAGLRSHQKFSPYPEEMNRILTDALSDLHFAPTSVAKENLLREGVAPKSITVTGNTSIDALLMVSQRESRSGNSKLREIISNGRRFILVTAHRRENFNEPLRDICTAISALTREFPDLDVIYSVHLNPNVKKPVNEILGATERVHLIDPPDYETFIHLMKNAYLILTDSGGIQEEAPTLGKPVIVLREVTERIEGIKAGTAVLAGTKRESIIENTARLLEDSEEYQKMAQRKNPYGDGLANERIVSVLRHHLGFVPKKEERKLTEFF
jgi:UDP-N-acetylglucosamine 2-epimerase (non-hydrolysing)